MRALTEDEIWHDPWEEAAAEGAVRRWIEEKKHRSSTTLRITSTSSAIPLSSFQMAASRTAQMPDSLLGWGQRTGWRLGRVRQPLRMYDVIILLKTSTFTCGDAPD